MKKQLTKSRADELLSYDSLSGNLIRKISISPGSRVGEIAGTLSGAGGYIDVYVDGCRYRAHRVIWLMVTGEWPKVHIDHIDGNKSNNRIINLREVNPAENAQNRKMHPRNTSGLRGVSWFALHGKWRAQICVKGKTTFLGLFEKKEDAHLAYLEKQRELHPFASQL